MEIKKAQYRQRIYQKECGTIILVFGSDAEPENAKLLADHDVSETVVVTAHCQEEKK